MSHIFIGYARKDRAKAKLLAEALEKQGFCVWWDVQISPGKSFDDVIQRALDAARCVIVLWSKASVDSRWVKNEARVGLRRRILVPVLIEDVPIPLALMDIQAANLVRWHGEQEHPELDRLLKEVESKMLATEVPIADADPSPPETQAERPSLILRTLKKGFLGGLTGGFLCGVCVAVWYFLYAADRGWDPPLIQLTLILALPSAIGAAFGLVSESLMRLLRTRTERPILFEAGGCALGGVLTGILLGPIMAVFFFYLEE